MSANKNTTKVVTGVVRLSYANVWEPVSINGGTPKYSVSLIIPKSDTKTIEAINARPAEDLFYRLSSVAISVPALRERGDDAALLFRKFALDMSEKYQMPPVRLNPEAQRLLLAYSWPGNVRQLKNLAENMSVTAETRDITPDILSRYLPAESRHRDIVPIGTKTEGHSFENEREILYQILFSTIIKT